LVDVRSVGEYGTGHISGARWVPRGLIESMIQQEAANQTESLIIYCGSGLESILSVPILKSLGYRNVLVLDGGFTKWAAENFPVEQGLARLRGFTTFRVISS